MSYTVLIPAAGSGTRMGTNTNKLLMHLDDTPIIVHTVQRFEQDDNCQAIYLATKPDERHTFKELLSFSNKIKGFVDGGRERQDSIYNMIKVMEVSKWVMVHDGARPFVSDDTLSALYEEVQQHDAVICGVRPKDTLKRVESNKVSETIDRAHVIQVHTPQAFDFSLLQKAYDHAASQQLSVTDDAMMVEALGHDVHVVSSDYNNIKVTTPEDIATAETILMGRDKYV